MKILDAHALAHRFDYPLFDNVDLSLEEGETMAIVGASGSGKSTLLHILSSLLEPNEGEVRLFGKEIYSLKNRALVALRRDDLGLVFQSHYLFKGFSAYENLEVSSILSGEAIDQGLLTRLGLQEVIQQKVTELSGGQQQRVSIARVLTKKPRIIFADEPTGNLDNATSLEVMELFEEYVSANRAALVLVTHNEAFANRCDKVYRLHNRVLEKIK
ncbi:ABC transporter ATP-binding protein [Sulfurimonas sp. HSL3-7]|uniref:ABC transporter ATP-binding protein n=1 Tax=Sulfonitrofixus jiaomeiensis TaxID=3131938 RepID=UPI0031F7AC9F